MCPYVDAPLRLLFAGYFRCQNLRLNVGKWYSHYRPSLKEGTTCIEKLASILVFHINRASKGQLPNILFLLYSDPEPLSIHHAFKSS